MRWFYRAPQQKEFALVFVFWLKNLIKKAALVCSLICNACRFHPIEILDKNSFGILLRFLMNSPLNSASFPIFSCRNKKRWPRSAVSLFYKESKVISFDILSINVCHCAPVFTLAQWLAMTSPDRKNSKTYDDWSVFPWKKSENRNRKIGNRFMNFSLPF